MLQERNMSDQASGIVRIPTVKLNSVPVSGREVSLRIDLVQPNDNVVATHTTEEVGIEVRIASDGLRFPHGDIEENKITLQGMESEACTVKGIVTAEPKQNINIFIDFFHGTRFCGSAHAEVTSQASEGAITVRSVGAAASVPLPNPASTGATASLKAVAVTGAFEAIPKARGPKLTVRILDLGRSAPVRWLWIMQLPDECRSLPGIGAGSLCGKCDLGGDYDAFVKSLYAKVVVLRKGKHKLLVSGLGTKIYEESPQRFREIYEAMCRVFGNTFPIQFISDEPSIPWELMQPSSSNETLSQSHPIARWLSNYETTMPSALPSAGAFVTVAPVYKNRLFEGKVVQRLPYAELEADMLVRDFGATRITGTREDLLALLQAQQQHSVSILHFAGHGSFGDFGLDSIILCSDEEVSALEVRQNAVTLGKQCSTFVVFHACEVGATGQVLGSIGGWAETLLHRGFSGFVAPLWSIADDEDAVEITREFFQTVLHGGTSPAEALTKIRSKFGSDSPSGLSYIYYGDVMARVQ
jgi:hypothetical protein